MKIILKQFLKYYLKFFTKLAILIHKPIIIAIAGSTNKTFVKLKVKEVLKNLNLEVRANPNNFNTEIGLPLAILNLPSGYNYYKNWLPALFQAPMSILKKFPKYLVLELGVSNCGDMKYLLSIIKPKVIIITDISQRYLEAFSGMDHLVDEYKYLVDKAKSNNHLILNNDNLRIREISNDAKAKKIYFGIKNKTDYWVDNIKKTGEGTAFNVLTKDKNEKHIIKKYGEHHVYAFLIAKIIKNIV